MSTPRQEMFNCFDTVFGIARFSLMETTKDSEREVQQKRIHQWNVRALLHISPTLQGGDRARVITTIANLEAQL